jgi:hypothetical protein
MCRSPKRLFKFISPYERSATVSSILLTHFLRNRNPFIGLVKFLVSALLAEYRIKILGAKGLPGSRMKERKGLVGHDSLDVEIMRGNL